MNLFIRGDFYCTFRIKLRASAMSGRRTDPPELGLAGKKMCRAFYCAQEHPWKWPLCSDDPVPSLPEGWDPSLPPLVRWAAGAQPRGGIGFPQMSDGLSAFYSGDKTTVLHLPNQASSPALASIALRYLLHGEAHRQVGLGTAGRCWGCSWETALLRVLGHLQRAQAPPERCF